MNSQTWRYLPVISLPLGILALLLANSFYQSRKLSLKNDEVNEASKSAGDCQNQNEIAGNESPSENRAIAWTSLGLEQPLVIAMVGLPARGKSYIVKMLMRYLKWTAFECNEFNVGSYRRKLGLASADSNFFEANNMEAQRVRENMAMAVQDEMYSWLHESIGANKRVAIFDATNTTKSRRLALVQRARRENVFLLFVESICDDEAVLARNYHLKLQNEDYKDMDGQKALDDFKERVHAYERVYETIEDSEDSGQISYIKLVNVGQKVITRNCTGYLPSQVAFYLQNVHIEPRKIFLSLHAEPKKPSDLNCRSLSSDRLNLYSPITELSKAGSKYASNLAEYVRLEIGGIDGLGSEILILTGTAELETLTVTNLGPTCSCYNTPLLNELRAGDFHGISKEEFKTRFPTEFEKRSLHKLQYRYPGVGGESYLDVIERIRPVIIELERQRRSVLIVCHMAVLRCIYAYFMGSKNEEIPYLTFQPHHIYELTPGPFGCKCQDREL